MPKIPAINLKPTAHSFVLGTVLLVLMTGGALYLYLSRASGLGFVNGYIFTPPGRLWTSVGGVFLCAAAATLIFLHRTVIRAGSRLTLAAVAVGAVMMFGVGLAFPPVGVTDSYWYTLSARGWVVHHLDPYLTSPAAMTGDPLYGLMRAVADHPNPYGPLAVLMSAVPVVLSPEPLAQAFGQRLLTVLGYAVGGLILFRVVRRQRGEANARLTAAFWFLNPYAVYELANAGHFDGLLVLALALFTAGTAERRPIKAVIGLMAATLIKIWPLVFFPALVALGRPWKKIWLKATAAGLLLALLTALPFSGSIIHLPATLTAGTLGNMENPYFFGPGMMAFYLPYIYATADQAASFTAARNLAAVLAGTLAVFVTWMLTRDRNSTTGRMTRLPPEWLPLALFGIFICFSPLIWPWYGLAALPLLTLLPTKRMLVGFTLVGIVSFIVYSVSLTVLLLVLTATVAVLRVLYANKRPRLMAGSN